MPHLKSYKNTHDFSGINFLADKDATNCFWFCSW
jgi:hypothetical protein